MRVFTIKQENTMIEYIDDVIAEVAAEMHDEGIRANDLNDPELIQLILLSR